MNILVTGAAGFIGSHLVDSLVHDNHKVYGVDDLSGGYKENVNKKSFFTQLDLRNRKKTEEYIYKIKPEIVFHLAADATEGRSQFTPMNCVERNINAYINVLVPAIKNGLQKMILTSSMSVYGSQQVPFNERLPRLPDDIYGLTKATMEQTTEILSKVHGFTYTIIRPHNVYGPRQNLADPYRNVIAIFINRLLQNKHFFIYGDGNQKRAFTYIKDCVPYIKKTAFLKKTNGEVFNIGPTKEYSINELAAIVLHNFFSEGPPQKKLEPQYIPSRPLEVKEAWCTVSKAENILGYKTSISLEDGVKEMIAWAKQKGPQEFQYLNFLEIEGKVTPKIWTKKLL